MESYPTFKKRINGISLNYVKIGSGKPLIFIHGWANNWMGWIPLISHLQKDFTLYLVDLPGFGHSGDLLYYSVQHAADYVAMFIKLLGITPVAVIGLSMGSFIVADLAKRYPQYFQSAILLGPLLKNKSQGFLPKIVPSYLKIFKKTKRSRRVLKRLIESRYIAYLVSKYVNMYKFNKDYVDKYGMDGKKLMRIEAFIDMGLSVSSYNLTETFHDVSIPTLLVYGREDKIVSYKLAQEILAANNNLTLRVIPAAGHMVHWEQSEKLANSIKNFIGE